MQPQKTDDCHIFGMHVAESLRNIDNSRNRAMCQLKIQELIFNYQFPENPLQSSVPAPTVPAPTYTTLNALTQNQVGGDQFGWMNPNGE